jgi:hypothetical protein
MKDNEFPMALPPVLKRIRLELARSKDIPIPYFQGRVR